MRGALDGQRPQRMRALALLLPALLLGPLGCAGYGTHAIQWDSRTQIYAGGLSQVRVRNAQSRTYDDADRTAMLEAVVATFQDLDFQIALLDTGLGVVSGRKHAPRDVDDVTYYLYDPEDLVLFSRSFRTWGPFHHRRDLVRLTVTVRPASTQRLIVRASAQSRLGPVEDPQPYTKFFATLEKSLFSDREVAAR